MASIPPINAPLGQSLSWLAFALNVSLHFSQVPLMRQILSDPDPASRARYSALPSIYQAAACALWVGYGAIVLPSTALIANNVIGLTLSLAYVAVFFRARPTWRGALAAAGAWAAAAAFAVLVYAALYGRPGGAGATSDAWASGITTTVTVALWMSPLAALRDAAATLHHTHPSRHAKYRRVYPQSAQSTRGCQPRLLC